MSDAGTPFQPVLNGGPQVASPDTITQPGGLGAMASHAASAAMNTYGAQLVEGLVTKSFANENGGDAQVPYDKAAQYLKARGYDASAVPKTGWTASALTNEVMRQDREQQDQLLVKRTNMSSTGQFVSGLAGGFGDPLVLAAGPILGKAGAAVSGVLGGGAAARVLTGAAEGDVLLGGEQAAQNHATGHDADTTSWSMVRDLSLAGLVGGGLHGAFGAKALAKKGENLTTDMAATLENSTGFAKAHGNMSPNDVISATGAVGLHQVEPATARLFGLKGTDAEITEQLKDPVINKQISQKVIDQNAASFPGDPEAQAIAYNDGPGRARQWIRSGRNDSVLPKETQGYLSRLRGTPLADIVNGVRLAGAQMASDSNVDVQPFTTKRSALTIQDEHDQQMADLHTQALQDALPKRDSFFTEDPEVNDRLAAMNETEPSQIRTAAEGEVDPVLAQHVADDEADAKTVGQKLGAPEGEEPIKYEPPEPPKIDGMAPEEHQRAVEAAVSCGLVKGGFSGT